MSVVKLVRFVDLCRSFGVEVSPAEASGFVEDFSGLDAEDRPLLEEAAVATLARNAEAETTVRRLFPLYFSGGVLPSLESEDGSRNDDSEQKTPTEPKPASEQKPSWMPESLRNARTAPPKTPPGQTLTPEQMESLLEALESSAESGEMSEKAAEALEALQAPRNTPRSPSQPQRDKVEQQPGERQRPQEMERLLQQMARRNERTQQRRKLLEAMKEAAQEKSEEATESEDENEDTDDESEENGDESQGEEDQGEGGEDGQGQDEGDQGQQGQGDQGQGAQGKGSQGQGGQGQGTQGQNGQGQGQGQDGQGLNGQGTGQQGRGQGKGGEGSPDSQGDGDAEGRGNGRGIGPMSRAQQAEMERVTQRMGQACAALIAAGLLSMEIAARLAAALDPSLARAFMGQFLTALGEKPSPQKQERLQNALEAMAGRLLAEGDLTNKEVVRLLSAADERLKLQNTITGAGLQSLLYDTDALADLLHRYRQNRDLLPMLVAKLADALRRMLTRPSPVMARSDTGRLDFRATMRESLAYGGIPLEFRYRRKRQDHEIVLALDTSGSQRHWAASAVLAAHALGRLLPKMRAYTFASNITDVTRYLAKPERFVERIEDFGGFSNYETSLLQLETEGRLNRRTTLILVGDCRDAQGGWSKEKDGRYSRFLDPESARVMDRLVKRCRRVIVLNPEEVSRWSSGDSAAEHYEAVGAAVLPVTSPLHLAEQLAHLALRRK